MTATHTVTLANVLIKNMFISSCSANIHSKILCNVYTFTDLIQTQRASVNCHDEQVPRQLEKCEGSGLKNQASEHVLVYNTTHISKRYWPPVSRKL